MVDLGFECYGRTRNRQVILTSRGGPSMVMSFPRFQMWRRWLFLQSEQRRGCRTQRSWETQGSSKTLSKSTWRVKVDLISKRFSEENTTGGMLRPTPNIVKEFTRNTSRTIYGFTSGPSVFLNGVSMRNVPSSKGLNIFFRLL